MLPPLSNFHLISEVLHSILSIRSVKLQTSFDISQIFSCLYKLLFSLQTQCFQNNQLLG